MMNFEHKEDSYEDIINLDHHVSDKRPHMSMHDRAAQFAPFAALTGYDSSVREAGRRTEERVELTEQEEQILDQKMAIIREHRHENPIVTFTYFVPDERKEGGQYVDATGVIQRIDTNRREIILYDGTVIPVEDIYQISGELFENY